MTVSLRGEFHLNGGIMEMLKTGLGGRRLDVPTTCFHDILPLTGGIGHLASAWACPGRPFKFRLPEPALSTVPYPKESPGEVLA